jgi:hypothetical protein
MAQLAPLFIEIVDCVVILLVFQGDLRAKHGKILTPFQGEHCRY